MFFSALLGHIDQLVGRTKIVNGQYADYGEFPHIAMVRLDSIKEFLCAGSLIDRWISFF